MKNNMLAKRDGFVLIPALLILLFALTLIFPIAGILFNVSSSAIKSVKLDALLSATVNSFIAASITTVISLLLAYILALCTERTAMRGKKIVATMISLPMLIPSVSIGMGTIILGGNNGIITNLLGIGQSSIYGLPGIVFGSVLYSLPVAYALLSNILKYEDSSPYDAAKTLGIGKLRRFTSISFQYLKKPLLAAAFSVFTLSFTDYGVPLMVGGKFKTLPMLMYQDVIGQLDFGKGSVYGMILLVPALIAFVLDILNKSHGNLAFTIRPFSAIRNPRCDIPAGIFSFTVAIVTVLPIISFFVLAFVKKYPTDLSLTLDHFVKAIGINDGKYLLYSVIIAIFASLIGVVLAICCAYYTARVKNIVSSILHLLSMSTAAIPGLVLGLSYVLFFKGSVIYGTLALLVIVNIVHFFASPYFMMFTSFQKQNQNLETVAATLGIGRLRLLFGILVPSCRETVAEMVSYIFVNCMMTISAVSFLSTTLNKPIALMINQFEAQSQLELAAVVSIVILAINLVVKISLSMIRNPSRRNG